MLAEGRARPAGARRVLAAALAAAALATGAGCRPGARTSFRGAPVVLISVDTLRADHLPAYGYRAVDTPNLDALRRDSVLFENAYSHVPLTLPSHTTIFTGLLPPQNGVRDNLGYALAAAPPTLAGTLRSHGYATGGAVSSIVLSHATGVSRGFDFWEDNVEPTRISQAIGRVQRPGGETEELLATWVSQRKENAPFFAFLHLFEPHTPYEPPEPYLSRYKQPYDGEIARADEIVGTFLRYVRDQGIYDRAIVIFLSDHGEGLDDHGEDEHGVLLYREAIHVPLMVKLPRQLRGGASVAAPAALTDVFPTVLELAALPPIPGLAGRSLAPELRGDPAPAAAERRIYGETLYPRLHLGWSGLSSLVDARNQYIESPRPELYDIVADPGERNDLAAGLPPAFRSMRAELSRMARPYQAPGASDAEQVKKLASLGYISASPADADGKDLPSPRDRIRNVSSLKRGFTALQTGRYEEAVQVLGELLKKEPKMLDVWQMYAEACQALGREAEALSALQTAARLSPGNPQILMALSDFYMSNGRFDEARKHAEAIGDAGTASPHEMLARIALAEGNLAEAEKEARAALERYPQKRVPRLILARVLHDRRDCAGALAELDLARRPRGGEGTVPFQNLNYLRGDCLARMGRAAEAEQAFREEIKSYPGNAAARAGLAMLYASEGREADARGALGALVADVATPEAYFAAIRTYEILGDPGTANELKRELGKKFPGARERKG
jgi:arylsulfatase A-like enzyme/Tfp pilus assembly protein PilF